MITESFLTSKEVWGHLQEKSLIYFLVELCKDSLPFPNRANSYHSFNTLFLFFPEIWHNQLFQILYWERFLFTQFVQHEIGVKSCLSNYKDMIYLLKCFFHLGTLNQKKRGQNLCWLDWVALTSSGIWLDSSGGKAGSC